MILVGQQIWKVIGSGSRPLVIQVLSTGRTQLLAPTPLHSVDMATCQMPCQMLPPSDWNVWLCNDNNGVMSTFRLAEHTHTHTLVFLRRVAAWKCGSCMRTSERRQYFCTRSFMAKGWQRKMFKELYWTKINKQQICLEPPKKIKSLLMKATCCMYLYELC